MSLGCSSLQPPVPFPPFSLLTGLLFLACGPPHHSQGCLGEELLAATGPHQRERGSLMMAPHIKMVSLSKSCAVVPFRRNTFPSLCFHGTYLFFIKGTFPFCPLLPPEGAFVSYFTVNSIRVVIMIMSVVIFLVTVMCSISSREKMKNSLNRFISKARVIVQSIYPRDKTFLHITL